MPPRLLAVLTTLTLLVACGAPEAAPSGAQVVAEETDNKITVNVQSRKPGSVKIGVRNLGTQEHSFVVLKTDLPPDKIPVDAASAASYSSGRCQA